MTPTINPAFAKYVVRIEPALPPYFAKNKSKFQNKENGLTVNGQQRKTEKVYAPRRRVSEVILHPSK
jgi:hypothetical protein